jgi:hypothetical protein
MIAIRICAAEVSPVSMLARRGYDKRSQTIGRRHSQIPQAPRFDSGKAGRKSGFEPGLHGANRTRLQGANGGRSASSRQGVEGPSARHRRRPIKGQGAAARIFRSCVIFESMRVQRERALLLGGIRHNRWHRAAYVSSAGFPTPTSLASLPGFHSAGSGEPSTYWHKMFISQPQVRRRCRLILCWLRMWMWCGRNHPRHHRRHDDHQFTIAQVIVAADLFPE